MEEIAQDESGGKCQQNRAVEAVELPNHLWENILARLPILSFFRMSSVCKSWNSMLHMDSFMAVYKKVPRQDIFFLLFADYSRGNVVAAYDPLDNTWALIPLSKVSSSSCPCSEACSELKRGVLSSGGLVLAKNRKGSLVVCNFFTKTHRVLPPMLPMNSVVAMVVLENHYKILCASTGEAIRSQVYDSRANSWKISGSFSGANSWKLSGSFHGRLGMLENAAYLNGFVFCLKYSDSLLVFDMDAGTWHSLEVTTPPLVCPHLLAHQSSLVLVGGVKKHGILNGISIWKLDEPSKQWLMVCDMPNHLFSKFSHGKLSYFWTVGLGGKLCFYKNYHSVILMYDLLEKLWWELPPCFLGSRRFRASCFGLAVEPRLDAHV